MKFRRTYRFHGLSRPRVRQTWNKYNLYNLLRNSNIPPFTGKTFFQQKWIAKSLTRGYHGEHIKERQWERMFSRRLASVVNMNPEYMALHDGSEQAAGRGRGLQQDPAVQLANHERFSPKAGTNLESDKQTPYMQMTFAPMERRLDIAIFRAMFASSARQARQFVVHGAVTVNGKKMIYPGYLLNPGDLFQVDVDRVLYATGAKKPTNRAVSRKQLSEDAEEAGAEDEAVQEADGEDAAALEGESPEAAAKAAAEANKKAVRELPYLAERAKKLLADDGDGLTVKRKKALRQFVKDARKVVAKATSSLNAPEGTPAKLAAAPATEAIVDRLADLLEGLPMPSSEEAEEGKWDSVEGAREALSGPSGEKQQQKQVQNQSLTPEERQRFQQLLAIDAENPFDPSKPYATPWRPRPFMQAFAFIPRYLEVNQNICAAVYLRHPVARPGQAEVPTPFSEDLHQLAFNWYLRRR